MYERIKVYYIYVYIQNLSQLLKNKHSECSHFFTFFRKSVRLILRRPSLHRRHSPLQ